MIYSAPTLNGAKRNSSAGGGGGRIEKRPSFVGAAAALKRGIQEKPVGSCYHGVCHLFFVLCCCNRICVAAVVPVATYSNLLIPVFRKGQERVLINAAVVTARLVVFSFVRGVGIGTVQETWAVQRGVHASCGVLAFFLRLPGVRSQKKWISKRKYPVVDAVAEDEKDDETMRLPRDYHGATNMQPAAHHFFELFNPT